MIILGIALHNLEYTESHVYELSYSIIIILIINLELNVGVLIFRLILIATKGSNQACQMDKPLLGPCDEARATVAYPS